MKNSIGLAILVFVSFLAVKSYANDSQSFTVRGQVILIGSDLSVVDDISRIQIMEDRRNQGSQDLDVVIARIGSDDEGVPVTGKVASGSFKNGRIELDGMIEKRTAVLVSVEGVGEQAMSIQAVVAPGKILSFAILDYVSPRHKDRLLLVGDSKVINDYPSKFTIRGDVSSITERDLSVAVAEIRFESGVLPDGSEALTTNTVLLDQGKFYFEGIVSEPTLVKIHVKAPSLSTYWGIANAVVEPAARINVSPSKTPNSFSPNKASELMATSKNEESMHTRLVEGWQSSDDYLVKMDAYAEAIRMQKQGTAANGEADIEATEEHVVVDPYDLFSEMEDIKHAVLSSIAQDLKEPLAALLAMKLGAPESRQFEMWDKLANALDTDLVERRVLPRYTSRMKQTKLVRNAEAVVKGQVAPEFTLANLVGDQIALADVLAENEVVLVDFWASWCSPCIESIPKLKELHSEYATHGFEIVFVSIDEEFEDWKDESERHGLPWINVGDIDGGFHAGTAVDYGVQWIPTEFALDQSGEILDREVSTEELEHLLADHFGLVSKHTGSEASESD